MENKQLLTFEEYRILVEQAPILIWRSDIAGSCDWFNDRWLEFTGRALIEEQGNGWAKGVHPEDLQRCVDFYFEHFNRQESFAMEYRLRRADGGYRWILDRGGPFYDGSGVFGGFIGSCIDITTEVLARQTQEAEHRRALEKLRAAIPVCAYCQKIRTIEGEWQLLERYLQLHSETPLTHGICPACEKNEIQNMDQEQVEEQS